jgi:hypothetical protein
MDERFNKAEKNFQNELNKEKNVSRKLNQEIEN